MAQKAKRLIACILILTLCLTCLPLIASAEDNFYSTADTLSIIDNIEVDAGLSQKSGTCQGACTDGKYAYFAIYNGVTTILKYDVSNFSLVDKEKTSVVDHANDMTYNPKINKIIVANNIPNYDIISILNPDTLEVEDQKQLDVDICAISYNEKRDQYIVCLSGTYDFALLDNEFKVVKEFEGVETGYTRQGCDSDDNYIYISQSDGNNLIVVYDYEGNHIKNISVGDSKEIENIFHIGNSFYCTLHYFGNYIYRLALSTDTKIKYTVNYDPNGGEGEMAPTVVNYGEDTPLSKCTFTREGFTFAGWIVNREYDNTYFGYGYGVDEAEFLDFDDIYSLFIYQDEVTVSETTTIGNITLKPYWIKEEYEISYDNKNCDTGEILPQTVKYSEEYVAKDNVFAKNGFIFTGYLLHRDIDNRYYGYLENGDKAMWLPKEYLNKPFLIQPGYILSQLTYNKNVTLIPQFKTAYTIDEKQKTISKYEGNDVMVNVPDNSNVRTISEDAFANSNIKSINIKDNIKNISSNAFNKCSSLKEVRYYDCYPTSISNKAFSISSSPAVYMNINGKDLFLGFYSCKYSQEMIKDKALKIISLSKREQ